MGVRGLLQTLIPASLHPLSRAATVRRMPDLSLVFVRPRWPCIDRWPITTILPGFLLLALIGVLASGCDRNIEGFQPGEKASEPDLARIFPGPAAVAAPSSENERGNSRAPDRAALPPSRAEGSETATTTGADPIEGTIELSDQLAESRPAGAVLFVIARQEGVTRGPPLAVLRIGDPEFPYAFSIGPDNVMIPSMRFEGQISLSARLDADGNAMTRSPEDISSPEPLSVAPGARGVVLELSDRS